MRLPSTILAALVSAAACAAAVSPTLSVVEWPDCEAATNAALPSATWQRRGHFDVQMSIAAGTNLVQLAFGRDADGDGVLSFDEADAVYGWRNGRYFAESVADGLRVEEPDTGSAASRVLTMNLLLKEGEGLSRFAATNGVGVAVFTNLSATAQGWLYKPDWNMMRVTRRGPGVPAEWFTCDLSSYYLYILMR